jgi:hypothetical protein
MSMRFAIWPILALHAAAAWVDCQERLPRGRIRRGLMRHHSNSVRRCWTVFYGLTKR